MPVQWRTSNVLCSPLNHVCRYSGIALFRSTVTWITWITVQRCKKYFRRLSSALQGCSILQCSCDTEEVIVVLRYGTSSGSGITEHVHSPLKWIFSVVLQYGYILQPGETVMLRSLVIQPSYVAWWNGHNPWSCVTTTFHRLVTQPGSVVMLYGHVL